MLSKLLAKLFEKLPLISVRYSKYLYVTLIFKKNEKKHLPNISQVVWKRLPNSFIP